MLDGLTITRTLKPRKTDDSRYLSCLPTFVFIQLLIHSFIHSLILSSIHSFIHSLISLCIYNVHSLKLFIYQKTCIHSFLGGKAHILAKTDKYFTFWFEVNMQSCCSSLAVWIWKLGLVFPNSISILFFFHWLFWRFRLKMYKWSRS